MLSVGEIYNLAIEYGMEFDPRGLEKIKEDLARIKIEYEEMKQEEKEDFDPERLTNPYKDSRILYGEPDKKVERILIGVDIDAGEVLMAERLNSQGKKIDLIISHHPQGHAFAGLYEVMNMQADILYKYGVPINVAEGILKERISEVERRVLSANHQRAVDAARLFDIPFMCMHTPCDNMVRHFLQNLIDHEKTCTLKDVVKLLKSIPEYKEGFRLGAGPKIFAGNPDNRTGKVMVDMTGGTEGSKKAMEKLSYAGIGTVIGMHFSEEFRKEAATHHVNLIVAGHIPSDNIGLNLMLDKLTSAHKLEIIACSGFRRVRRS